MEQNSITSIPAVSEEQSSWEEEDLSLRLQDSDEGGHADDPNAIDTLGRQDIFNYIFSMQTLNDVSQFEATDYESLEQVAFFLPLIVLLYWCSKWKGALHA